MSDSAFNQERIRVAGGRELAMLLAEVGRAIGASLDTIQIAQTVVNQAVRIIHADRCAIYFFSEDQSSLLPIVAIDVRDPATVDQLFYAYPLPVAAQPIFAEFLDTSNPVVVRDTFDDTRTTREFFELFDTRSLLSVPLRTAEKSALGVLGFFWTGVPHSIDADEIELAAFIGDQTTVALTSARLRDELSRERTRLANIIESMRDGVLVYAPDGRIEFTNALASELLGLTRPVVGLVDALNFDIPSQVTRNPLVFGYDRRAVFDRVLERKEAVGGLQLVVESPVPRLLDITYAPLLGGGDELSGVVVTFRDITELRELERVKAAHEANLTLGAVIDSTANGVVVYDNQSRIMLANPFVHDLYDLPEDSIVGLTASEFAIRIAPCFANNDELAGAVSRVEERTEGYTEELEIVRPRRRIIRRVISPVHTRDGTRVGKVAVYHDVTRERAIDRQKDEFLSLASHELKTPLTSIKGYTQVLLNRAEKEGTPERERRALRTIVTQVDRMAGLVGELLDISRIDSGQLRMELASFDLTELVARVIEQTQLTTTMHQIELESPPTMIIVGDAGRLEQVITNLLENAIKYSPDGGPINLRITQRPREVYLDVQDRGIGIPQAQLAHLFTRFYRAHNVGSTISGLGLGLYISHEIVLRHQGRLTVESREGRGSTFRVVLPIDGPTR